MAFWIRGGIFTGWRVYYKLFRMKGFWLLGLWIGFNDILPTALSALRGSTGPADGVAHWAHLGGFASGVLIAVALLCTRQVNAHGADILSVVMGPKAWAIIGKPTGRGAAAK
jgi:membrane associated rhomboid family serine protease